MLLFFPLVRLGFSKVTFRASSSCFKFMVQIYNKKLSLQKLLEFLMQFFPCSFYILVKSLFPCGSVMYNSDYLFRFQSMRKAYPRIAGGNSSELPETASSRLVIILIVALYLSSLHIYL